MGNDESYALRWDKEQRNIDFVKSVRIGDCLALIPTIGQDSVLGFEKALLKAYFED
jgi:hypothetical protein